MGLFDSIKRSVTNEVKKDAGKAVTSAAQKTVNAVKGQNKSETFTFSAIPTSLAELQSLPEASLDSPYKTAALTVLVMCAYEQHTDAVLEMIDWLNGPNDVSGQTKQFLRDRLSGKYYKPYSFFKGATVENNYTPTTPYTITVSSNPYSFTEEGWARILVKSAGADSERFIQLRSKPSTGQWFLNNSFDFLADIRTPAAADPWA